MGRALLFDTIILSWRSAGIYLDLCGRLSSELSRDASRVLIDVATDRHDSDLETTDVGPQVLLAFCRSSRASIYDLFQESLCDFSCDRSAERAQLAAGHDDVRPRVDRRIDIFRKVIVMYFQYQVCDAGVSGDNETQL